MYERTHVDLFTGIGGFALAARANGVRTIAMCECDPRCQAFLAKAWPGVPVWPDVRTFGLADAGRIGGGQDEPGRGSSKRAAAGRSSSGVWLLTAGVPCQPASRAGKQRGKDDMRWLWPEALRVIAAVQPTWALLENPPGIGDVGLSGILSEVEAQGYEVRVLSIPACAVNAPHRRERFWIVCRRIGVGLADSGCEGHQRPDTEPGADELCSEYPQGDMANAVPCGQGNGPEPDRQASERRVETCERGQGSLGNAGHQSNGPEQQHKQGKESRWGPPPPYTARSGPSGNWSNYVWLPCADGKVRRAPDDTQRMAHGLPVELLEELGTPGRQTPEECEIHRSILGALGNSIVWPVAAKLIEAMIRSEES